MKASNETRIDRAENVLHHFYNDSNETKERVADTAVIDLLTDLRHLCNETRGFYFEDCVRISEQHFQAETQEEQSQ